MLDLLAYLSVDEAAAACVTPDLLLHVEEKAPAAVAKAVAQAAPNVDILGVTEKLLDLVDHRSIPRVVIPLPIILLSGSLPVPPPRR